jgi:hypothetical protein
MLPHVTQKFPKGTDYVIILKYIRLFLRSRRLVIKRAIPPVVSEPSSSVEQAWLQIAVYFS